MTECIICGSPEHSSKDHMGRSVVCGAQLGHESSSSVSNRRRRPLTTTKKPTIKEFAREYFVRVNYVDVFGRNVGFDYDHILAAIKVQFPNARTSKKWLRKMAYELTGIVRMPTRRRSRRALAEEFAMSVLMRVALNGGIQYQNVAKRVRQKFPDQPLKLPELRRLEGRLRSLGFTVPERAK